MSINLIDNPLAQSIAEVEAKESVPAGYARIELSTKGRVGAPKVFHIRNFKTSEVMSLALTEESDLPGRILEILENLIYEDVDVYSFHEKEVTETIVLLFSTFYSNTLLGVPFKWNETDIAYLESLGEEGLQKKADLISGKWKPTVDISITKDVDTFPLGKDFKTTATITDKQTGFSCEFSLPKYGDSIILRKWLKETFEQQDKSFAKLRQLIDVKAELVDKYQSGEPVDISRMPVIDEAALEAYKKLQEEKALILVDAIKAMHLTKFDGEDVSQLPLSEKLVYAQDSRMDFTFTGQVDKYFEKLNFGINPMVMMNNPITGVQEPRRYLFRLSNILQAMQIQSADKYDIVFS